MLINGKEINVAQRRKEIQRKDADGNPVFQTKGKNIGMPIMLSQSDIAKHCGISITAEQRYENDTTKNPMPEVLTKLAEILEIK